MVMHQVTAKEKGLGKSREWTGPRGQGFLDGREGAEGGGGPHWQAG